MSYGDCASRTALAGFALSHFVSQPCGRLPHIAGGLQ